MTSHCCSFNCPRIRADVALKWKNSCLLRISEPSTMVVLPVQHRNPPVARGSIPTPKPLYDIIHEQAKSALSLSLSLSSNSARNLNLNLAPPAPTVRKCARRECIQTLLFAARLTEGRRLGSSTRRFFPCTRFHVGPGAKDDGWNGDDDGGYLLACLLA